MKRRPIWRSSMDSKRRLKRMMPVKKRTCQKTSLRLTAQTNGIKRYNIRSIKPTTPTASKVS